MNIHQLIQAWQQGQRLTLQPDIGLDFPATSVSEIESGNIVLRFLSLLGSHSPLPHYFITDVLEPEHAGLRAFIAIVNRVIYEAYFYAWMMRHAHLFPQQAFPEQDIVNHLLPHASAIPASLKPLFLFKQKPRIGLNILIEGIFPFVSVDDLKYLCDWESLIASSTPRLGQDAVLGHRIPAARKQLQIVISVDDANRLSDVLPYTPAGKQQWACVMQYLTQSVRLSFVIKVNHQTSRPQLGRCFLSQQPKRVTMYYA